MTVMIVLAYFFHLIFVQCKGRWEFYSMQGKVTERRCKLTVSRPSRQPGIQAGVDGPKKVFQVDLRCQYSYSYPIHYSHYYEPLHQLQIWIRARLGNSPALTNDQACAIQRSIVNIQGPQKGFWKGTLSSVSLSCHSPVSLSGVAIWCHSPFQCPVWFLLHRLHWYCSYKYKQSRALYVDTTCFEKPHKNMSTNPIPSPDLPHFVCFHN